MTTAQRMLRGSSSLSYLDWVRCLVGPFLLHLPSHSASSMPLSWAQPLGLHLSSVPGGPFSLLISSKVGILHLLTLLTSGSFSLQILCSSILKLISRKKASVNNLPSVSGFPLSTFTLQSFLSCGAVGLHALAEGLALGVAAPKAYRLGRHMVLPVSLHGLPRGAAVASCIFGATDSWHGSLAATTLIGFVGPVSAIGAILSSIDYSGLDHVMVFACGALIPCFVTIMQRAARLDTRKSTAGLMIGVGFATICLTCTRPRTELGVYKRVSRIVSRTREWLCRIFPYR